MITYPHLGHDEEENITLEWWNGIRKITMYPASHMLLTSWGTNVETEMEEISLTGEQGHSNCKAAFKWLYE